MFGTFRHEKSQSGHGLSVLEPLASPFERSSYKISRIACVYCRFKKVKCTGEEQGCQRCLGKQITCSYTAPARGNSETTPRRIPRLGQNTKRTDVSVSGLANDMPVDDVSTRTLPIEANIDLENIMASPTLFFSDYDLANASISSGNESAYLNLNYSYSDSFQTVDAINLTPAQTPDTEDLGPHEPNNLCSVEGALKEFNKPSPNACLCSELVKVFEIVQLGQNSAEVKNLKDHSSDTMESCRSSFGCYSEDFSFQKEALKSCEKWLSQDALQIRSQHAVLIIEILEKLLKSIISMAETSLHEARGSIPPSPSSPGEPAMPAKKRKRSTQEMRDTTYSHQNEHLMLDDEERAHVLKSVFVFRASRLKGVMERMAAIAASNQWRAHEFIVKDLIRQLNMRDDLQ